MKKLNVIMETITINDITFESKCSRAITFTLGHDIYVTKDLARDLNLPEKKLLFHLDSSAKMSVSATDSKIGFPLTMKQGMIRLLRARSISKFMVTKGIRPGTRIIFHDEPDDGYFIEAERRPTQAKGVTNK